MEICKEVWHTIFNYFYFIFRDLVVGAIVRLPHSQVRELSIVSKPLFVFNFWVLF